MRPLISSVALLSFAVPDGPLAQEQDPGPTLLGCTAQSSRTEREREICAALGPELKKRGLLFTGIDVIGGMLTEINVTSPTGLVALDQFDGINSAGLIWDAVEERLK